MAFRSGHFTLSPSQNLRAHHGIIRLPNTVPNPTSCARTFSKAPKPVNLWKLGVITYFAIGLMAVAIWPLRQAIVMSVREVTRTNLLHVLRGTKPPSPIKIWLFTSTLSFGALLVWPVFSVSVLRAQRREQKDDELL